MKLVVYSLLYVILLIVSCNNPGAFPYLYGILRESQSESEDKDNDRPSELIAQVKLVFLGSQNVLSKNH